MARDPLESLPEMLTTEEMARFLNVSIPLLNAWRSRRVGPAYIKVTPGPKGAVRYPKEELRDFLVERRQATEALSERATAIVASEVS